MERIDIGDDPRLNAIVEAASRGDGVLLSRDGEAVAEVSSVKRKAPGSLDLAALRTLQEIMAPLRVSGETGAESIRRQRDESDH